MLYSFNDVKLPHTLKRRRSRSSLSKEIVLLLWSTGFFPFLMQCLCSSFTIKATVPKHVSPPTSLHTTVVFTSFQFDQNGVCIVPKYFIANRNDNEPPHYFTMQNVPGDGDCMFLAVALAAATTTKSVSPNISTSQLLPLVADLEQAFDSHTNDNITYNSTTAATTAMALRNAVADVLEMSNGTLYISHNRTITTHDLLHQASKELKIVPTEYIQRLRQMGGLLYGGGPELTILCHLYQRPIHIYEIDYDQYHDYPNQNKNSSSIRIMNMPVVERGVFGDGVYAGADINANVDSDLHILVVDVTDDEKHACVLFPVQIPLTVKEPQ